MNKYQIAFEKIKKYKVYTEEEFFGDGCSTLYELVGKELDVLQKLVDKATPKKVVNEHKEYVFPDAYRLSGICPNCKNHVDESKYCSICGQKLDWSKE